MQDRYFGDVGDFGKFGLLRALSGVHPSGDRLRLGVIWYLTDDETGNNDGKHLGYQDGPTFAGCDDELLDTLVGVRGQPRAVSLARERQMLGDACDFVEERLSLATVNWRARAAVRNEWFENAVDRVRDCDIVFCDPDNGLARTDAKGLSPRGAKFALPSEIARLYKDGHSVVLYHHADRSAPVSIQCGTRARELADATGAGIMWCLRFHRGTTRLYFVLPSAAHLHTLQARTTNFLASPWAEHFDCPDRDLSPGAQSRG